MRKFIIILMVLVMPFSALEMRADEEKPNLKIPVRFTKGSGKLVRDLQIAITADYYATISCICTMVYEDLGEVEVYVTNHSTGEFWMTSFDSSCEQQVFLQISGTSGYYEIEYVTESGDIYSGSFTL